MSLYIRLYTSLYVFIRFYTSLYVFIRFLAGFKDQGIFQFFVFYVTVIIYISSCKINTLIYVTITRYNQT